MEFDPLEPGGAQQLGEPGLGVSLPRVDEFRDIARLGVYDVVAVRQHVPFVVPEVLLEVQVRPVGE